MAINEIARAYGYDPDCRRGRSPEIPTRRTPHVRIAAVLPWLVRASLALWGFAFAIGLMPSLQKPAGPDELPGAMRALGLSSSGPTLQFALGILVPFLCALLAKPLLPKLKAPAAAGALQADQRWVAWSFCIALASAPVTLMHFGNVRHVVLHGVAAAGIVFARRLRPRFTRVDIVLVPTLLGVFLAFHETGFGKTPAPTFLRSCMVVFALRLAVGAFSKSARPALAFAATPLAFLFQMQWLEHGSVIALVWIFVTPFLLARVSDERLRRLSAYVTYPIAVAAYPLTLVGIVSPPFLDVFEDGHSLLPASEMGRGELPYRDVVPMHGLISDGLLDLVTMKAIAPNLGAILTTRRVVASLTMTAIYFATLAATTSADLALLSVFLSLSVFPAASLWMRAMPSLFVLACIAAATRLRRNRWFAMGGGVLVFAALVSLDLAAYSTVVAIVAAIRSRAIKHLSIGIAIVLLPLLLIFLVLGILPDFFSVTLFEVLSSGGIYVKAPFEVPDVVRTLAHMAARISLTEDFAVICWVLALIGAAASLTRSPLRAKRSDAVWMIALWLVLAGASWIVRRHYYFAFALGPFLVGALLAVRRHSKPAAIALAIALAFVAKPFSHVFDLALPILRTGGGMEQWVPLTDPPRARGAHADMRTKAGIESVGKFINTRLKPDETFYDFTSVSMLYFLFDRESPARHPTIPAYESPRMQQEMIAELERNQKVRAALIHFPTGYIDIDGIHNRDRAPLLWKYLQENFEPAFDENGVVFWMRRDRTDPR
jgi:hypothetical protein